jgi:hypothetical protein
MLHKLGKHPKVVDRLRRTLQIRDYLDLPSLPPPPPSRDWTCGITNFGEMLNNQLSDCVAAAAGHMIQVWTAANGQEITVPDSAIQQAYQDVGGYVPGDPSTDNGMDMLSFLKYWRTTGVRSADLHRGRDDLDCGAWADRRARLAWRSLRHSAGLQSRLRDLVGDQVRPRSGLRARLLRRGLRRAAGM